MNNLMNPLVDWRHHVMGEIHKVASEAFAYFGLERTEYVDFRISIIPPADDFDTIFKVKVDIQIYSQRVFKTFGFLESKYMVDTIDIPQFKNARRQIIQLLAAIELPGQGFAQEK